MSGLMAPADARKFVVNLSPKELLDKHIEHLKKEIKELGENKGIFNSFASFFSPKFKQNQLELKNAKLTGLQELKTGIGNQTINNVATLDSQVKKRSSNFVSGFFSTTQKIIDAYRDQFTAEEKQTDREIPLQTFPRQRL